MKPHHRMEENFLKDIAYRLEAHKGQ